MDSIALDKDIIAALLAGEIVAERLDRAPKCEVGDIIPVKETYAMIGGEPYYMADLDDIAASSIYGWRYANTMPLAFVKRKVQVVAIKKMPYKEFLETYKNEISYNKKIFAFAGCPYDRWFRPGYTVRRPLAINVFSVEYKLAENME